jgi:hypothetical protein
MVYEQYQSTTVFCSEAVRHAGNVRFSGVDRLSHRLANAPHRAVASLVFEHDVGYPCASHGEYVDIYV